MSATEIDEILEHATPFERLEIRFGHHIDRIIKEIQGTRRLPPKGPVRFVAQGVTDANGNGEFPFQGTQPGPDKQIVVSRIIVWVDGFTPGDPYVGTTGATGSWIGIFHGKGMNPAAVDDFSPISNSALVLPNLAEYSGRNGPVFAKMDDPYFAIQHGPVTTNVTAIMIGWLEAISKDAGKLAV